MNSKKKYKKSSVATKKKQKQNEPLKVLIIASEMVPFIKAGGLSDIVGALPIHLKKLGVDVRVVLPKYSSINYHDFPVKLVMPSMGVWMGNTLEWCSVHQIETPDEIPVFLIEHNLYFNRYGLYHDQNMHDYDDNPKRFAFLSRAGLQFCIDTKFSPDIVHANDWQTALAPAYLKTWHWNNPFLGKAASVLTIHNLAYQGVYPYHHWSYIGLGDAHFTQDKFESYRWINMLKGGIYFADMVNTVSPNYAKETKTPEGGFGLAPYLSNKENNYVGILNGVDYNIWSPEKDKYIACNYSKNNIKGKKICKRALQKEFLLNEDSHIAVIGAIGRFVHHKGFHLIAQCIDQILNNMHVQFVVLGDGEGVLEHFFGELPKRFPGKAGSFIGFNNRLAHVIQAGCDFLLMPSLHEPCGLNQLYAMRYGTLPIVRATGGLDDTVVNYNEQNGDGTGFKFWQPSSRAVYYTVGWAISTYYDRPHHMSKLILNAMSQNFSWEKSAKEYLELYKKAIEVKKEYDNKFL